MESNYKEIACQLERCIDNPGLEHIPRQVFESMDLETIKACRQMSKRWRDFIDFKTNYWKRYFPKIRKFITNKGKHYHPKTRDRYRYKNPDSESDSDLDLESDDDEFYEHDFIRSWWIPIKKIIAHFEDTLDNEIRKGFVVMMLESIAAIFYSNISFLRRRKDFYFLSTKDFSSDEVFSFPQRKISWKRRKFSSLRYFLW